MTSTVLEIDSDVEEVILDAFAVELARQLKGEEDVGLPEDDPERLMRETEPYPPLPDPTEAHTSGERAKAAAQLRQQTEKEASTALAANDVQRAVDAYTLAMRTGGATGMMLANRAALMLKQKRPCAAIRDCTAALKINPSMAKAYRIRGIAHRKLGHWRKAHSDVNEAQALKFDTATADMQKFLAAQCLKLDIANGKKGNGAGAKPAGPERRDPISPEPASAARTVSASTLKDLDKGQAVIISGLQKAPELNGRRGVVERCDPRPAARGRWEVELRMDGGKLEVKSLKRENITAISRTDKAARRAWALAEKAHREERQRREEQEERTKCLRCMEAKMSKWPINESTQALLRKLRPQDALSVLDKVDGAQLANVNEFLTTQVKLLTEQSDSDDEPASKRFRE